MRMLLISRKTREDALLICGWGGRVAMCAFVFLWRVCYEAVMCVTRCRGKCVRVWWWVALCDVSDSNDTRTQDYCHHDYRDASAPCKYTSTQDTCASLKVLLNCWESWRIPSLTTARAFTPQGGAVGGSCREELVPRARATEEEIREPLPIPSPAATL